MSKKLERIGLRKNGCPTLAAEKIEQKIDMWMKDPWIVKITREVGEKNLLSLHFRELMRRCVLHEWLRQKGGHCGSNPANWKQEATEIRRIVFEKLVNEELVPLFSDLYVVSPMLQDIDDMDI